MPWFFLCGVRVVVFCRWKTQGRKEGDTLTIIIFIQERLARDSSLLFRMVLGHSGFLFKSMNDICFLYAE